MQFRYIGPIGVLYLTEYNLKNLRILDLCSNALKPQGAFYLSHAGFNSLRSLNLNFCELEDEGLYHISNGCFNNLAHLFIFHNKITFGGIKYLVNANFSNNLTILSLSENPEIGDKGIKYMTKHKGWEKLTILNLNFVGLTDISIEFFIQAYLPKLRCLNIKGNNLTNIGLEKINALRLNNIKVRYRTKAEVKKDLKEQEKKMKEKKKK